MSNFFKLALVCGGPYLSYVIPPRNNVPRTEASLLVAAMMAQNQRPISQPLE